MPFEALVSCRGSKGAGQNLSRGSDQANLAQLSLRDGSQESRGAKGLGELTGEVGLCHFACAGSWSCAITEQLSARAEESPLLHLSFGSAEAPVQPLAAGQLGLILMAGEL